MQARRASGPGARSALRRSSRTRKGQNVHAQKHVHTVCGVVMGTSTRRRAGVQDGRRAAKDLASLRCVLCSLMRALLAAAAGDGPRDRARRASQVAIRDRRCGGRVHNT